MKLKKEPDDKKKNQRKNRSLEYSLWLLGRRAYTEKQIRDKLESKKFEPEEIENTLRRLLDLKFVDDFEFARSFVRQAKLGRPKGAYRIKFELKQKGLKKELIECALADENFEENEAKLVESALKLYLPKIKNLSREKQYRRTMAYLLCRGFSYNEAKKALSSHI